MSLRAVDNSVVTRKHLSARPQRRRLDQERYPCGDCPQRPQRRTGKWGPCRYEAAYGKFFSFASPNFYPFQSLPLIMPSASNKLTSSLHLLLSCPHMTNAHHLHPNANNPHPGLMLIPIPWIMQFEIACVWVCVWEKALIAWSPKFSLQPASPGKIVTQP